MLFGMLKYHLLMLVREPASVFFGLGLPFLMMFVMGSGAEDVSEVLNMAFPLYVMIAILVLTLLDSSLSHVHSRQIKFLRRLKMTPVKKSMYLFSDFITRLGVLLVFTVVFSLFNVVVFDLDLVGRNWFSIIGMIFLVYTMFYVLGMFIANVFKNTRTASSFLNIGFWGLLLSGNFMLNASSLPEILRLITENIPTVFATELMQSAWLGMSLFDGHSFIIVFGIIIVFGALTAKFFKYE